jgi:hypothetical protein
MEIASMKNPHDLDADERKTSPGKVAVPPAEGTTKPSETSKLTEEQMAALAFGGVSAPPPPPPLDISPQP